jgi:TM2 domain-containing membrane protein YozV
MLDPTYLNRMNPQQRAWFYAEYAHARKEEIVGVLLALFLGAFGIHKFYLRQNTAGVFYLLFCWTGITAIISFFECFLMPGRVRAYNAAQAAFIAGQIVASSSPADTTPSPSAGNLGTTQPCSACNRPLDTTAAFCTHCGTARTVPA